MKYGFTCLHLNSLIFDDLLNFFEEKEGVEPLPRALG